MNINLKLPLTGICFLLSCLILHSYCSTDVTVDDVIQFEECSKDTLLNYPFLSADDRWRLNKMVLKSSFRLTEDPTIMENGKEIKRFGKRLKNLVIADDTWKKDREIAFVLAIAKCSTLITETIVSELLKDLLYFDSEKLYSKFKNRFSFPNYESKLNRRSKRDSESFAVSAPTTGNGEDFPKETRFESVMFDVLFSSPIFAKVFHVGVHQRDAIVIAKTITETGLEGFESTIIKEALNVVSNEMLLKNLNSNTENYAKIISRTVARVLNLHDLTQFSNGMLIANKMLRKIENLLGYQGSDGQPLVSKNNQQSELELQPGMENKSPESNLHQMNIFVKPSSLQKTSHGTILPVNNALEFQIRMASLLLQSPEISEFFCKSSSMNIFQTVKKSLSDLGPGISINAAIAASDSFAKVGSEIFCKQYASILSKNIKDILVEYDMLKDIDPTKVFNNILFNLKTSFKAPSENLGTTLSKENSTSSVSLSPGTNFSVDAIDIKKSSFPSLKPFTNIPELPHSLIKIEEIKNPSSDEIPASKENDSSLPVNSTFLKEISSSSEMVVQSTLGATNENQTLKSSVVPPTEQIKYTKLLKVTVPPENVSDILLSSFTTPIDKFIPISSTVPSIIDNPTTRFTAEDYFISTFFNIMDSPSTSVDPYIKNLTDSIDYPTILSELLLEQISSLQRPYQNDSVLKIKGDHSEKPQLDKFSITSPLNTTEVDSMSKEKTGLSYNPGTNNSSSTQLKPNDKIWNIELQPSFKHSSPTASTLIRKSQEEHLKNSKNLESISSIASSSIAFIKSSNFNLGELCNKLNELADLANIPPLPADNCSEIPLVDYLLHVLKKTSSKNENVFKNRTL